MASTGTKWANSEVRVLLVLWAEPESQEELNRIHRNKLFFDKLADRLAQEAFHRRTAQSCRDKVNRIRGQYRALVDKLNLSGQDRDDDEPFWFKIVDGVLNKSTRPVASLDSGAVAGDDITDDILIFSSTLDEHLKRLDKVLTRRQENGLRVKGKKCSLLKKEVTYLGHVMCRDGIAINE